MNYKESRQYLEQVSKLGSILGLDTIKQLLKELHNPEKDLRFIHIAGTNGKGSTAAYISYILASAGYRIGRYISPVIQHYREKIQLLEMEKGIYKQTYISEEEVAENITKISIEIQKLINQPTIFEIETVMAFLYFKKLKCDLVVLETGLGGREDATNVVQNTECAVITSISMDHIQLLGDCIEKIAYQKAGIIKNNCKVVYYKGEEKANCVIEKICKEKNTDFILADSKKVTNLKHIFDMQTGIGHISFSYPIEKLNREEEFELSLIGENQYKNSIVAIETALILQSLDYDISIEHIKNGLYHTKWKGRFEVVALNPMIIVDGAHNKEAAYSLRKSIQLYLSGKRLIYIVGVLKDKDYFGILENTVDLASKLYTITPDNERALDCTILANAASNYMDKEKIETKENIIKALDCARTEAKKEDIILIFGSLSFLSDIYKYLK